MVGDVCPDDKQNFASMFMLHRRAPVLGRLERQLGACRLTRALSTSTYYDSQSGRTVTMPTGPQIHLGMTTVPSDRVSSALAHLLKDGKPVRGLASVFTAVATDERSVEAVQNGQAHVCIEATSGLADAVAAVKAAIRVELEPRVLLPSSACVDPHDVQLSVAELGDAGAAVILLSVDAKTDADDLREMAEMACEIDLVDVPMRARLGLCVSAKPAADALKLVKHAHAELGMIHFYACLAGVHAPKPTELLKACGVRPVDMASGPLMLAEFVPDAA